MQFLTTYLDLHVGSAKLHKSQFHRMSSFIWEFVICPWVTSDLWNAAPFWKCCVLEMCHINSLQYDIHECNRQSWGPFPAQFLCRVPMLAESLGYNCFVEWTDTVGLCSQDWPYACGGVSCASRGCCGYKRWGMRQCLKRNWLIVPKVQLVQQYSLWDAHPSEVAISVVNIAERFHLTTIENRHISDFWCEIPTPQHSLCGLGPECLCSPDHIWITFTTSRGSFPKISL